MGKRKRPTVPYSKTFGEFLKSQREKANLTQQQVAKVLGIETQNISNWERGLAGPSFDSLVELTKILKISPKLMLKVLMDEQMRLFKYEFGKCCNE